ncbi:hypothetical protein Tco_0608709 [Tanacetum coccineum]
MVVISCGMIYYVILMLFMIIEEFTEVYLPDSLAKDSDIGLSISKLKESLVVLEYNFKAERRVYGVWMMEDSAEKLFTKLLTIDIPMHPNKIQDLARGQIRGFPGDLSLGIAFPGDMSPGISGTEKLEWDSFPGDIAGPT